jgi:spermidine/putrescine transport system substrate-binding protein
MTEELRTAPELSVPEELQDAGQFLKSCPPDVHELYTRIWTEVSK